MRASNKQQLISLIECIPGKEVAPLIVSLIDGALRMTLPKSAATQGRRLEWFIGGCLLMILWLTMVSLPWPANEGLDSSWQTVLVYAHAHGWMFGTQLIFSWGHWGFLCSVFHLGVVGAVSKLAWESLGKLILAFSLLRLIRDLPLWRRILFVVSWIFLTDYILDVSFLMLILLAVVFGLMRRDTKCKELIFWSLLLAALAKLKFTYTLITIVGADEAAIVLIERKQPGNPA